MSDTQQSLRHKINSATELESVVRTMKALAATSIVQYERAVRSLDDYYRTVELGLVAWLHHSGADALRRRSVRQHKAITGAVLFGSDQGLVGQFNETLAAFSMQALGGIPGQKIIWTVGERIQRQLADTSVPDTHNFPVPNSIAAITALVGRVLAEIEVHLQRDAAMPVYLFHNRPKSGAAYEPAIQRLLPLDEEWWRGLSRLHWPARNLPEVVGEREAALQALIREYLFISLFRACTESLASENATRLAAMQRAEKNIDELLENLNLDFHRRRQSSIDEELFDVIAGFEALR